MDIVDEWDSGVPSTAAHIGESEVLSSEWTVVDRSPDTPGPPPILSVALIEHAITRCVVWQQLSAFTTFIRGRGAIACATAASDLLLIATDRAAILSVDAAAPSTIGMHPTFVYI